MTPEQLKNSEMDRLIHDVLRSDENLIIPPGLAGKTIHKLEKKIFLRELVLELSWKTGIVIASLAILAGVFVWINGNGVLNNMYSQFVNHGQLIISLLLLVFVTIVIDQVVLRFFNEIKKQARGKSA